MIEGYTVVTGAQRDRVVRDGFGTVEEAVDLIVEHDYPEGWTVRERLADGTLGGLVKWRRSTRNTSARDRAEIWEVVSKVGAELDALRHRLSGGATVDPATVAGYLSRAREKLNQVSHTVAVIALADFLDSQDEEQLRT